MTILKNIGKFLTDPKNTRMIMLGVIVIICLLFLRQCNKTQYYKKQVELEKQETKRVANNYDASIDTIKQYKIDSDTWRSEKSGYELSLDELENKYSDLLGDFEIEKNRPPKVVIKTEYVIKDSIINIPILVQVDSFGNTRLEFNDSTYHDSINYRLLSGIIPYKVVFDPTDSLCKVVPSPGNFNLILGMNLNLGLFQDKNTRKVYIKADTDYPGVTFTTLDGASIMDDPANKKILRNMRKPWGLGFNAGYGAIVNVKNGQIATGPYFGVGLSYTPKFLQWGR